MTPDASGKFKGISVPSIPWHAQLAVQRRITPETTITDAMTTGAHGTSMFAALGKRLDLVYQIPDSDSQEFLLRFVDGPVLLVGCDLGFDDNDRRTNERWDVYVADASETEAGEAVRYLDPGEWL